ncbi:AraC family transcriptional regulator [Paenibacillus sacheonensis]|uniref:Helix-turn-helix domain-containing protein n=1 Tax=Paenibacillus sacheonensis TaxID=742054 RepID=A0A7X4YRM6_9BACL|nr:AraC family transcriptional regulator [Paenibacillus sacheonensis]MBM7567612.1 AraC-like DNA-binding protein [Paenibacillus sacheonensis]NBC71285.1 helix-turn-helix domain-containing protein [Paenibacillus sacheonensis]
MKTTFFFDNIAEPVIIPFTPLPVSSKLPYQLCTIGHVHFAAKFYTEREKQKNYQIIYTESGSGVLHYEGKRYALEKNQAVLIHCTGSHRYHTGPTGTWKYRFMHIKGTGCPAFYETINPSGLQPVILQHSSEFNYCFDKLMKCVEDGDHRSDLAIPALIMRILTELSLNRGMHGNARKSDYHQQVIEDAIVFMEAQLGRGDFSVAEVARNAGFNESYFSRLFKRMTGTSTQEYLMRLRIDRSKHLLKKTMQSVSDVAYEVGFENVNVYIRDFKKLTGVTPLKYRLYADGV